MMFGALFLSMPLAIIGTYVASMLAGSCLCCEQALQLGSWCGLTCFLVAVLRLRVDCSYELAPYFNCVTRDVATMCASNAKIYVIIHR
jgi:hypothetical protein